MKSVFPIFLPASTVTILQDVLNCCCWHTIDREIFTLKIIHAKNVRVDIFLRFVRSAKFFLMVEGYNMDMCRETNITGCNTMAVRNSRQSDIYLRKCMDLRMHAHSLITTTQVYIHVFNFHS